MFLNDFVLAPDAALTPSYRISPFRTSDILDNRRLPDSTEAEVYFRSRFPGRRVFYCESARQGLGLALQDLGLAPTDVVTILTTTGNLYISGCVTREIEKVCRWSRKIEPNTRCILVNHEFGFPYERLRELSRYELPIIEDAAHSFSSNNTECSVATVGEYVIYSFPKFFPVQLGGLLLAREGCALREPVTIDCKRYLQKVVSFYLRSVEKAREARRHNYASLRDRFETLLCPPRFEPTPGATPGVFMFRTPPDVELPALKIFMQQHGIESSVFYGESAFFVPVHQRLSEADLDYFVEVVKAFMQKTEVLAC